MINIFNNIRQSNSLNLDTLANFNQSENSNSDQNFVSIFDSLNNSSELTQITPEILIPNSTSKINLSPDIEILRLINSFNSPIANNVDSIDLSVNEESVININPEVFESLTNGLSKKVKTEHAKDSAPIEINPLSVKSDDEITASTDNVNLIQNTLISLDNGVKPNLKEVQLDVKDQGNKPTVDINLNIINTETEDLAQSSSAVNQSGTNENQVHTKSDAKLNSVNANDKSDKSEVSSKEIKSDYSDAKNINQDSKHIAQNNISKEDTTFVPKSDAKFNPVNPEVKSDNVEFTPKDIKSDYSEVKNINQDSKIVPQNNISKDETTFVAKSDVKNTPVSVEGKSDRVEFTTKDIKSVSPDVKNFNQDSKSFAQNNISKEEATFIPKSDAKLNSVNAEVKSDRVEFTSKDIKADNSDIRNINQDSKFVAQNNNSKEDTTFTPKSDARLTPINPEAKSDKIEFTTKDIKFDNQDSKSFTQNNISKEDTTFAPKSDTKLTPVNVDVKSDKSEFTPKDIKFDNQDSKSFTQNNISKDEVTFVPKSDAKLNSVNAEVKSNRVEFTPKDIKSDYSEAKNINQDSKNIAQNNISKEEATFAPKSDTKNIPVSIDNKSDNVANPQKEIQSESISVKDKLPVSKGNITGKEHSDELGKLIDSFKEILTEKKTTNESIKINFSGGSYKPEFNRLANTISQNIIKNDKVININKLNNFFESNSAAIPLNNIKLSSVNDVSPDVKASIFNTAFVAEKSPKNSVKLTEPIQSSVQFEKSNLVSHITSNIEKSSTEYKNQHSSQSFNEQKNENDTQKSFGKESTKEPIVQNSDLKQNLTDTVYTKIQQSNTTSQQQIISSALSKKSGTEILEKVSLQDLPKIANDSVIKAVNDGKNSITLVLKPEMLGKVVIEISMHENMARLNFNTDSIISAKTLEQNLPLLNEKLAQHGIKTDNIDIKVNSNEQNNLDKSFDQNGKSSKEERNSREDILRSYKILRNMTLDKENMNYINNYQNISRLQRIYQ